MLYPKEFKEKVLLVFGNNEDIKKMLDSGNEIIGRLLDDASHGSISAKEVVEAYESMNHEAIYQKAKRKLALEELYNEWAEMYRNQNGRRR